MIYSLFRYYKCWVTRLLLLVAMFFGAFIFSTCVGNSQSLQQRYSVEFVREKADKPLKHIVSYSKVLWCIDLKKVSIYFPNSQFFLALEHNRIAKVMVDSAMSMTYLVKVFPFSFLQRKTIPQASDDEFFMKLG